MPRESAKDKAHADIDRQQANDPRVLCSDAATGQLTGMGRSWRDEQRKAGKIRSARVGTKRMDIVASVYELLHALVDESYAQDGVTLVKIRSPKGEFKPRKRTPTENELRALAVSNQRRRGEAIRRREAANAAVEVDASS